MKNKNKRKQCCKCYRTFYKVKQTYKIMNDTSIQDCFEGDFEPDYERLDKKVCPHCGSDEYIII